MILRNLKIQILKDQNFLDDNLNLKKDHQPPRKLNIYVPDDRVIAEDKYPEKAVGIISYEKETHGIAALEHLFQKTHSD